MVTFKIKCMSLNCKILQRGNGTQVRDRLIEGVVQRGRHLIALQDTHVDDRATAASIEQRFQCKSGLWTHYCGLLSMSSELVLERIPVDLGEKGEFDERVLFARVFSPYGRFDDFYALVVYAPPHQSPRKRFYNALLASPLLALRDNSNDTKYSRLILMGDFNYNDHVGNQIPRGVPKEWKAMTQSRFLDCVYASVHEVLPTYRLGRRHSTIDYIFAPPQHFSCKRVTKHTDAAEFLPYDITDHAMIQATLGVKEYVLARFIHLFKSVIKSLLMALFFPHSPR
ncbi:Endonuclease/exonuclease/phosphatase [Syncephalastrum racemosum]|uniref:Endonuclease/exonuclease/phosphatase n=1 Tax=Syncephalastrum racemosum TaxID=13706 RepID=A0A1X2HH74_SYNRA|nr:Endonuclease/exonuclease/phosphatase [Syncephalastrum racemosum]